MYGQWILVLGINPEPWASGTTYATRKGGVVRSGMSPNEKLKVFKAALTEELRLRDLKLDDDPEQLFALELVFCREVERWVTGKGAIKSGNHADTTNLQKATEDALQGILLHNDRQVVKTTSVLAAQTSGMQPFIAIKLSKVKEDDLLPWYEFCMYGMQQEQQRLDEQTGDNKW